MAVKAIASGGNSVRVKQREPKDSDYRPSGFDVDEAENGIIVTCRYQIKDNIRQQYRKMEFYPDTYKSEKHVFEDYAGAADFVSKELKKLTATGAKSSTSTAGGDADGY